MPPASESGCPDRREGRSAVMTSDIVALVRNQPDIPTVVEGMIAFGEALRMREAGHGALHLYDSDGRLAVSIEAPELGARPRRGRAAARPGAGGKGPAADLVGRGACGGRSARGAAYRPQVRRGHRALAGRYGLASAARGGAGDAAGRRRADAQGDGGATGAPGGAVHHVARRGPAAVQRDAARAAGRDAAGVTHHDAATARADRAGQPLGRPCRRRLLRRPDRRTPSMGRRGVRRRPGGARRTPRRTRRRRPARSAPS